LLWSQGSQLHGRQRRWVGGTLTQHWPVRSLHRHRQRLLDSERGFEVSCENGFEGTLSADALGITACLYAFSHVSFGEGAFAETCAEQYHLLREYTMDHPEVGAILAAID
jgi:hypothetical protein